MELKLSEDASEGEVGLLELLIVLAKRKWMIFSVSLVCATAAMVYGLLSPKIYTANTKILPPQQTESMASAMLGQLGSLAGLAGRDLGIRNPNDIYVAMLESRTVSDALIAQFDLKNLYSVKRMMDARKRLADATTIDSGKDGVISISVDDRDPKRAADIANAYVGELYKLTQTLAVTEAGQRRLFYERQLRSASDDLARAEQGLRNTEQTTGLVQLDSQAKAMIDEVSTARAKIAAKEVEIQAMQAFATPQNPDLVRAEVELEGLKDVLAQLEKSQTGPAGELQLPVGKVPSAGLEYVDRLRDVKYQETIFELLEKQYEIAKIDEAKNALSIQVLDAALPPEWKSKPKVSILVIVGGFTGFFCAVVMAFAQEALAYAETQPRFALQWRLLKKYVIAKPYENGIAEAKPRETPDS